MGIQKDRLPESIIQQFWDQKGELKLFKLSNNLQLNIISRGVLNFGQGPDFASAHVLINDLEFWGDIEIHVKSSDWNLHSHHLDRNYNKVILHVVWENDVLVYNFNGELIPTLVLSDYFHLKDLYKSHSSSFECFGLNWQDNYNSHIRPQLDRALNIRFQDQIEQLQNKIKLNKGNVRRSLIFWVASYFVNNRNRWQLEIALNEIKDSIILKKNINEILYLLIVRTDLDITKTLLKKDILLNFNRDLVVYKSKYPKSRHNWNWEKSSANRGLALELRMLQIAEFLIYAFENWDVLKESSNLENLYKWFGYNAQYSKSININLQIEVWVNTIGIYHSFNKENNSSLWKSQLIGLKPKGIGVHKRFLNNLKNCLGIENKWQDHAIIHQVKNWCNTLNCSDCHLSSCKNNKFVHA